MSAICCIPETLVYFQQQKEACIRSDLCRLKINGNGFIESAVWFFTVNLSRRIK